MADPTNTTPTPKSGQPVDPSKQKFGRGGLPRLLPELANADSNEIIEAAKATARFVPFDPAFWVKCAETAQMDVGVVEHHSDLWLSVGFINTHHVDNLFLSGWLHETPDGTDAVKAYLEKRNASSLGRRDFLFVGTAAAVTSGMAIAGGVQAKADERLTSLAAEHEHAEALFEEAAIKQDRASMAARRHYPERPECLVTPARVNPTMIEAAIREEYDVYLIEKEDNEDLKAQVDALDKYKAECAAVDARFGVPELEEKRDRICDRTCEIETQMAETPARSMAGIAAKLKVWMINQAPDELIGSAAQDAQRLAEAMS